MVADLALEGREGFVERVRLGLITLGLVFLLLLQLELGKGWTVKAAACDAPVLQASTIETRTVVVEALANDLAAADNDTAMSVVEWRLRSLLKAQSEVVVSLHFGD